MRRFKEFSKAITEDVDIFVGKKSDRPLSDTELARAVRRLISAEHEAVQLYEQLAESTPHKLGQKLLRSIADEEKVHVGELTKFLTMLAPDEEAFYDEGEDEVDEMTGKS